MPKKIDLMIVGAQKSGSTSLFRYLSEHPEFHAHRHSEMSFFMYDHEYREGYERAFSRYFGRFPAGKSVLLAKHAMAMYSGTALERIHRHNPDICIAVILRNPLDRAYSAYWYARRNGWEDALTFEDALDREKARLREGWLKWRNSAYVFNGSYYPHVKRLYDTFGEGRVHVFLLEDLQKSPLDVCKALIYHFDVSADFDPSVAKRHNRGGMARSEGLARAFAWFLQPDNPVKNAVRTLTPDSLSYRLREGFLKLNEREFTPPPMDPGTRTRLAGHFRPLNCRLGELLGRDLAGWGV